MFASRLEQAQRRRAALVAAGCATYVHNTTDSILCLCCGRASHNPNDIDQKYCGFCHEFHVHWRPPALDDPTIAHPHNDASFGKAQIEVPLL